MKRKTQKKHKITSPDLNAIFAHLDLFPHVPTKVHQRMLQIVEAAIECYGEMGVENTSLDAIAKKCRFTRPLIQYYFSNKREIFILAYKYIRSVAHQVSIDTIRPMDPPKEQFESYLRSFFIWALKYPSHGKVWLLFYSLCVVDAELRHLNTQMVQMGLNRITALLTAGIEKGDFQCSDPIATAKAIQHFITGALLSAATEDSPSLTAVSEEVITICIKLAKG